MGELPEMHHQSIRRNLIPMEMIRDIDRDTVDFMDNYDGSEQEPTVLPAKIPALLLNGSSGIAVGMATNIPPHNLGELIDGICYFDLETVSKYFTDRFYINKEEGIVLYTTEKDIYKTYIGEEYSSYTVAGAENALACPAALLIGEELYLSADYVKIFANFTYEYFAEPNRMLLYTEWGTRQYANITKDTKLRYQGGVKSPILKDLPEGEKVFVLEVMEKWSKVITEDALIGYVENKRLEEGEMMTQTPATDAVVLNYQSISREGKINMAFHQVFSQGANSTYDAYMAETKSVNVIAPTWFRVKDEEGTLECIASTEYVTKAHNKGIEVWAVVTDVDYSVNIGAILSSSEKREAMVSTLIAYAQQYDLDGINVERLADIIILANKYKFGLKQVQQLNEKYPNQEYPIFHFIYRERKYNKSEEKYLGWERKRGALLSLSSFLLKKKHFIFLIFWKPTYPLIGQKTN